MNENIKIPVRRIRRFFVLSAISLLPIVLLAAISLVAFLAKYKSVAGVDEWYSATAVYWVIGAGFVLSLVAWAVFAPVKWGGQSTSEPIFRSPATAAAGVSSKRLHRIAFWEVLIISASAVPGTVFVLVGAPGVGLAIFLVFVLLPQPMILWAMKRRG